jgi:hypothetical protein
VLTAKSTRDDWQKFKTIGRHAIARVEGIFFAFLALFANEKRRPGKEKTGSVSQGMAERAGEFRMSTT